MRRLLRGCRAGRVGSAIPPSLDRLSREVPIAANLFHKFATLGLDVLIADMPTYNGKDRPQVAETEATVVRRISALAKLRQSATAVALTLNQDTSSA